jgi:hypothetical protein
MKWAQLFIKIYTLLKIYQKFQILKNDKIQDGGWLPVCNCLIGSHWETVETLEEPFMYFITDPCRMYTNMSFVFILNSFVYILFQ